MGINFHFPGKCCSCLGIADSTLTLMRREQDGNQVRKYYIDVPICVPCKTRASQREWIFMPLLLALGIGAVLLLWKIGWIAGVIVGGLAGLSAYALLDRFVLSLARIEKSGRTIVFKNASYDRDFRKLNGI